MLARGLTLDPFFGGSLDASDFSSPELLGMTNLGQCLLFGAGEGWTSSASSDACLFLECGEELSSSSSSSSSPIL